MVFPSLMILSLSLNLLLIEEYHLLFIIDPPSFILCLIYTHSIDHGGAFFLHSEAIDLIYF